MNEVPSPKGGTYWAGDKGDSRDFTRGIDTNDEFRHRLLGDVLQGLVRIGILDKKYGVSSRKFISEIQKEKDVDFRRSLMLMDMTEYGRMVHAEMNAVTDAARNGISIDRAIMFCTTFPCHICAKHIIAAGLAKVVYIEPYPKSYTQELYRDEIFVGRTARSVEGRVHFEPFVGIAPFRYQDFFEKSRRKDDDGRAKEWQRGPEFPFLKGLQESYPNNEQAHLRQLIALFAAKRMLLPKEYESEGEAEVSEAPIVDDDEPNSAVLTPDEPKRAVRQRRARRSTRRK